MRSNAPVTWPPVVEVGKAVGIFAALAREDQVWSPLLRSSYDAVNRSLQRLYAHAASTDRELWALRHAAKKGDASGAWRYWEQKARDTAARVEDKHPSLEGRSSLLSIIEARCKELGMSERALCEAAGVSPNTVYNLRWDRTRSSNLKTVLALLHALDLEVTAAPAKPKEAVDTQPEQE